MRSRNISGKADTTGGRPVRLRDFVEDADGWLYAVSTYDNSERIGCILRYIPDPAGERVSRQGRRYRKIDFSEAYALVATHKPDYANLVHRVPRGDIRRVLKPDDEMNHIISRDRRVGRLAALFDLPSGTMGCTGSLLCGLESSASDIDLVVYGKDWFRAQALLQALIGQGTLQDISEETWQTVYRKRNPEISYEQFMRHEVRKWNRGEIEGTYFDLLYTRGYEDLPVSSAGQGRVLGRERIEALVTDASLSFDNPAVYEVEHDHITRVLSFTHTYSGQALAGEVIEAAGVREAHPGGDWLVIGTTREARGEYILSKTLLES